MPWCPQSDVGAIVLLVIIVPLYFELRVVALADLLRSAPRHVHTYAAATYSTTSTSIVGRVLLLSLRLDICLVMISLNFS